LKGTSDLGSLKYDEPGEAPNPLATSRQLRIAIGCFEGLEIPVCEAIAVVDNRESLDVFDGWATCRRKQGALLRSVNVDVHPPVGFDAVSKAILGGVNAVDDGLEQGQESVLRGNLRVAEPSGQVHPQFVMGTTIDRFRHDTPDTSSVGFA